LNLMQSLHAVFLALGRASFDVEAARRYFEQSKIMLESVTERLTAPNDLLMSPEETAEFLKRSLADESPDVLVVQTTTFVDARFIKEIMEISDLPVIMWGVREPNVNGTRLSLNSMTGLNNLCNYLAAKKRKFQFVFGNPNEQALIDDLKKHLKVLKVVKQLKQLKIGVLGRYPDGFFFSDADPGMLSSIGPQIVELDLEEAFRRAGEVSDREIAEVIREVGTKVKQLDRIPQEGVRKFAAFQTALTKELKRQGIGIVGIRCWPEFFSDFGAAACSTVSWLTDAGVMASCESDIHGAITMYIQHQFTQSAPYLGDMVHIDENKNSAVFWHCGAGAISLARKDTGVSAGVQPNRKLGFTLEFGLKAGQVSVHRLGPDPHKQGKYRMLMLEGEALDEPQKFWGTTVEVGFGQPIVPLFKKLIKQGFEPHYSIVYGRIQEEMKILCEWLDIEPIEL